MESARKDSIMLLEHVPPNDPRFEAPNMRLVWVRDREFHRDGRRDRRQEGECLMQTGQRFPSLTQISIM